MATGLARNGVRRGYGISISGATLRAVSMSGSPAGSIVSRSEQRGQLLSWSIPARIRMRAAEIMSGRVESSVPRPQCRSEGQRDRGQQVHVDEANALAVKTVALDEHQRFVVIRDRGGRKVLKQFQNFLAVG